MDRIRFALWFGLLASVWISYTTWVTDNQPERPPAAVSADGTDPEPTGPDALDVMPTITVGDEALPTLDPGPADAGAVPADVAAAATSARQITVTTDVLDLVIGLDGGDIVRAELPHYPVDKQNPDDPIRLLNDAPSDIWVFQTGLRSATGAPDPNHREAFSTAQSSYALADGADTLEVRLDWTDASGLSAQKIFTFRRGEYRVDLELVLENRSGEAWRGAPYAQMLRYHTPPGRSFLDVDSYSFTGPAVYNGDSMEKLDVDDLREAPWTRQVANGWLASIQHHFLAALVPRRDEVSSLSAEAAPLPQALQTAEDLRSYYLLRAIAPTTDVPAGTRYSYPLALFVGPKLQDQLEQTGQELERTVDYGKLSFLSQPLFWLLDWVHGYVGNWGWAIVLVTIMIKLVFYKLTATSGRSMAKMRKLAPRMKALQEKHKDDRQALSAAMMELYKKEKVNPAAGCLPILIQMPFFFAFYWVLIESVEMRQAPFALWISDLSVRDPFFILPALMTGAMLFQMRLNPAPPDPVQAKVMQIMPIAFGVMFAFFPAGLVLYWLTNTVFSIAQQWRINQLVARES